MAGNRCARTASLFAFVGSVVVSGCAGYEDAELATLKTRASFDLDCPKSEIKTVTIDDETRGVIGCGQRLTYVQVCQKQHDFGDNDCNWILNTDSRRARAKHLSDDEE
jgi:hypothetical protein